MTQLQGLNKLFPLQMLSSFDPTTGEQVSEQFKALMIGELYEEVTKTW